MKDKELRKLLADQGIIRKYAQSYRIYESSDSLNATNSKIFKLEGKVRDLESKLDAINKHYGIEVERQDARYVVKESE